MGLNRSSIAVRGLSLLFAPGTKPDRSAIRTFVEQNAKTRISHDSAAGVPYLRVIGEGKRRVSDADTGHACIELLREGLTFDCVYANADGGQFAASGKHRFDVSQELDLQQLEWITLSRGTHLAGGGRAIPVVRSLLAIANDFIHYFNGVEAVHWSVADAAIGTRFFESTVSAWLDGGPFPALGLTVFEERSDGSLESLGLAYFIDQEIRIERELAEDKLAATRLGIRLVNQLVLLGKIVQTESIVGPDGNRLLLKPSRDGNFVRVSRN